MPLFAVWVMFLKGHHEQYGWGSLATNLTDTDLLTFVTGYPGLFQWYKYGVSSWRPAKRHQYQTYVASIIQAIECIGANFASTGELFPQVKPKAIEVLDTYFASNRTRLLDIYMPRRAQVEDKLRQSWQSQTWW